MGAGILPTTIYKNQLYFLFGKENKYEDTAHGFADFGGGTDKKESFLETAIREGTEELTGFLGSEADLRRILKQKGSFPIDYQAEGYSPYRTHLFPMEYDPALPFYYNNNQRFLQKRLDPNIIKNSKIFEKEEIRWVSINELNKMRSKFRFFFLPIIDQIYKERETIRAFMENRLKKMNFKKKRKNRKIYQTTQSNKKSNKTKINKQKK
jgi:8-oxo-dGTP pyrophosphatase MutT (NUDIX family)